MYGTTHPSSDLDKNAVKAVGALTSGLLDGLLRQEPAQDAKERLTLLTDNLLLAGCTRQDCPSLLPKNSKLIESTISNSRSSNGRCLLYISRINELRGRRALGYRSTVGRALFPQKSVCCTRLPEQYAEANRVRDGKFTQRC